MATIHLSAVGAEQPLDSISQAWPAGWRNSYVRFQNYIEARAAFPASDFKFGPDGEVFHSIQANEEMLGFDLYRNGSHMLSSGIFRNLFANGRRSLLYQGKYYCVVNLGGFCGYQYLYPIASFELVPATPDASQRNAATDYRIQMLDTLPEKDETTWPNQRLFLFKDYHVFPKTNRFVLYRANKKVSPALCLKLSIRGKVSRDKFDDSLEKHLFWRIYFNGNLVENGSASGITEYTVHSGTGTYQVLVGVNGPHGFMPVSNLLEFPIFPDPLGGITVIPADSNKNDIPDIFENLPSDNLRTYPPGISSPPYGDAERQNMENLWVCWFYYIKNYKSNSEINPLANLE